MACALRAGGDDAAGRELILRSIELARQIGNRQREATALSNVVLIHMDAEDYDRAVVAAKEATEVDRALNDPWGVAINQLNMASALLHAEGPGPARALVEEIAQGVLALDDVELSIDMVETIAAIAASAGDAELAASLVGAADAKREGVGMPRVMTDDALLERFVGPARAAVGPALWESAYRRGRSDSIEEAVARATSVASRRPAGGEHRRQGQSYPLRRRLDAADSLTGPTTVADARARGRALVHSEPAGCRLRIADSGCGCCAEPSGRGVGRLQPVCRLDRCVTSSGKISASSERCFPQGDNTRECCLDAGRNGMTTMIPLTTVVPAEVAEWMGMDAAMLDFAIDLGQTDAESHADGMERGPHVSVRSKSP